MRNVHIKANGGAPVTLTNWEGTTFANLKAATSGISYGGCRVVIRGSQTDLVDDSALIPNDGNDVFIFVTPAKMNAGGYSDDKAYAKSQYNASAEGKSHFAGYNSVKANVLAQLVHSWNNQGTSTSTDGGTTVNSTVEMSAVRAALQGVQSAVDNLGQVLLNQVQKVGGLTLEELNAEYNTLVAKTKTLCSK